MSHIFSVMTLRDHLRGAREQLTAAGVNPEEAALDVELLAQDILGVDRASLIANLGDLAPEGFGPAYDALILRRAAREPVAYIRGRQAFWGRDFLVTPAVLIPRPETEFIVEEALAGAFRRALDIGTGSGCLAVTLALELSGDPDRRGQGYGGPPKPRAKAEGSPLRAPVEATLQGCLIVATDISEAALAVARENADRLLDPAIRRSVDFRHGTYAAGAPGSFDLIVSNPPYVTAAEYATLEPEVRAYEPADALVAGEDGLRDIREIVRLAPFHLTPGGRLLIEIGYGQADAVRAIVGEQSALRLVRIREDLQGIPRTAIMTPA
jgi:release factor glutamine methyltransferase